MKNETTSEIRYESAMIQGVKLNYLGKKKNIIQIRIGNEYINLTIGDKAFKQIENAIDKHSNTLEQQQ